jgi:hypothetical protein
MAHCHRVGEVAVSIQRRHPGESRDPFAFSRLSQNKNGFRLSPE